MVEYEVTFKHRINGQTRTIKLGDTRPIANEKCKEYRKTLSWWWKCGKINCGTGNIL